MNKIITSADELDDLDLDLDNSTIETINDELSLTETKSDDLELNLDTAVVELPTDTTNDLVLDDDKTTIEDLSLDTVKTVSNDTLHPEIKRVNPLDEEIDLDLDVNEFDKNAATLPVDVKTTETVEAVEKPKRGRKPKTVEVVSVANVEVPANNSPIIAMNIAGIKKPVIQFAEDFDISQIVVDKYEFLISKLSNHMIIDSVEQSVTRMGTIINPLQVSYEDGIYFLISGYASYKALTKLGIKTAPVLVFSGIAMYDIAKRSLMSTVYSQ